MSFGFEAQNLKNEHNIETMNFTIQLLQRVDL